MVRRVMNVAVDFRAELHTRLIFRPLVQRDKVVERGADWGGRSEEIWQDDPTDFRGGATISGLPKA